MSSNYFDEGDSMLENPSFSDLIDLICSFCDDPENITAYDRAMYDIHLKDECQQKLNEAIKKFESVSSSEMSQITGNLNIPGMF